jgi:hypothetical protein
MFVPKREKRNFSQTFDMKTLTILLLTLLFPVFVIGETMDDLVERDGIHYKKFSDVPFTGKITGKSQGSFKNGKRCGPWVSYWMWKGGLLMSKGNYKDGEKDGPWVSYNEDGTVRHDFTGTLKNGKKVE